MRRSSRERRERRKARRQLWNDLRQCRAHLVTVEEYSRQMGLSTPEADFLQLLAQDVGVQLLMVPFYPHEPSPKSRRS